MGQYLPVNLDIGPVETVDKARVVKALELDTGVNLRNPELALVAFLELPANVGAGKSLFNSVAGDLEARVRATTVAFRQSKHLFVPRAGGGASLVWFGSVVLVMGCVSGILEKVKKWYAHTKNETMVGKKKKKKKAEEEEIGSHMIG